MTLRKIRLELVILEIHQVLQRSSGRVIQRLQDEIIIEVRLGRIDLRHGADGDECELRGVRTLAEDAEYEELGP